MSIRSKYVKPVVILMMDIVISVFSSLLAILLTRLLTEPIFEFTHYVVLWADFAIVGSLIGFLLGGTHRVVLRHSTPRNVNALILAVVVKELILLALVLFNVAGLKNVNGGLLIVLIDFLLTQMSLILSRVMIVIFLSDSGEDDMEVAVSRSNVLIFGTSNKSTALLTRLETSPNYNVVGFIDTDPSINGMIIRDKKVYNCSNAEQLQTLQVELGGVECMLFARNEDAVAQKDGVVAWCMENGIHILVTPKVKEIDMGTAPKEATKSITIDSTFIPDGMGSFQRNVKRLLDFGLSALLIVVFSPLMLICYIAIKLEDHGPALYKQERIGRFGRPFNILKFRSMRTDAEKFGPALYSGDEDPRLTKVGKFLRQHHLDELPQLFNVFKGEMAFIGYRPERKFYIDQIMQVDPRYVYLYQIRPGVTSYATLYNGYTDTVDKMVRRLKYDLYYLQHRSWWFDIKTLWLTFTSIVFGKKF